MVANLTGEAAERPTKADVLIEMKRHEWGPHLALSLRTRRRSSDTTTTSTGWSGSAPR